MRNRTVLIWESKTIILFELNVNWNLAADVYIWVEVFVIRSQVPGNQIEEFVTGPAQFGLTNWWASLGKSSLGIHNGTNAGANTSANIKQPKIKC